MKIALQHGQVILAEVLLTDAICGARLPVGTIGPCLPGATGVLP